MIHELIEILNKPGSRIAVVGATDQPFKYGAIIYRHLKNKGYHVVPVNPGRTHVDGDPCYPSVRSLPEKPDLVNIVTPPEATHQILEDCLECGLMNVWIQPGAADASVIRFLQTHSFCWVAGDCVMMWV